MPASILPEGALVLVTGINGFIGGHVANEFLAAGYKVRGTTRDPSQAQWLAELFEKKYGPGRFEIVAVPEQTNTDAFDEAVKDVYAVIHVALNWKWELTQEAINKVIVATNNVLNSAAATPTVKRVVLTSSSVALLHPIPNKEFSFDSNTWNDAAVKAAKEEATPPAWSVYAAIKTLSERACWDFVKEKKPHFEFNSVNPNCNFGPALSYEHLPGSTWGWANAVFTGETDKLLFTSSQHFIDVRDDALLHVGAATLPGVANERLLGFAEPFGWNDVLAILRKLYPERKFIDDLPNTDKDLSKPDTARSVEILKILGRPGWRSLEESLKDQFDPIAAQ